MLDLVLDKRFSLDKELYPYQLEALESIYYRLTQEVEEVDEEKKNRASLWMATGSGKTLVIVKLIELLRNMMDMGLLGKKNILFLTARDDLIEQFLKHVDEFNRGNSRLRIEAYSLKDYEKVMQDYHQRFHRTQLVFYYRSDLISDERKEKVIDYRSYDNDGNWYIILDEAHKGDYLESKRKRIIAHMARNGFLFNFSATFTDRIDIETCIYNFNLEKFVQSGYGKDVYVSEYDLSELGKRQEFSESEKRKIMLKLFVLLTALKQIKKEIGAYYHKPLMVALVNSVNVPDSDLELLFKVIESIAVGSEKDGLLLERAKEELAEELGKGKTFFTDTSMPKLLVDKVLQITKKDILREVFNAESHGGIELKVFPNNRQELLLSLKTSSKPFGLIKIGDIGPWIGEKLKHYEITESFMEGSEFKKLDDEESSINLLLGSRSFYEGWDSSRPNLILFVNLGQKEARKFVLQAIGRGVRVNPFGNHRRRWQYVKELVPQEHARLEEHAKALETLFVYGTKASEIRKVIDAVRTERTGSRLVSVISRKWKKPTKKPFNPQLDISKEDFELFRKYFECLPDVVFLVKYETDVKTLLMIEEGLKEPSLYFNVGGTDKSLGNPDLVSRLVIRHLEKLKDFKQAKMEEGQEKRQEEVDLLKIREHNLRVLQSINEKLSLLETQKKAEKTKQDFLKRQRRLGF